MAKVITEEPKGYRPPPFAPGYETATWSNADYAAPPTAPGYTGPDAAPYAVGNGQIPAVWMAKPGLGGRCPSGLEYLSILESLMVKKKMSLLEVIAGWEVANKYLIYNAFGQHVYHAKEKSSCLQKQCCGSSRAFDIVITDHTGLEVMHVKRKFRCLSCWGTCCPCSNACLNAVQVDSPTAGLLGYIRQERQGHQTRLAILDASENVLLRINSGHLCCNCSCLGKPVDFKIVSPELGGEEVGTLTKLWGGCMKECFTDANNFTMNVPMTTPITTKALVLASLFLIDFMFFEYDSGD